MKKISLFLFAVLTAATGFAQEGSAEWNATVAPVGEGLYDVTFDVRITPGWHIYDIIPYDIPSMATAFDFSASDGVELVGELRPLDKPASKFDDIFGFEVWYHEGFARYVQKVRPTGVGGVLAGEIEYQVCNDEQCIRGVWEFGIPIGEQRDAAAVAPAVAVQDAADDTDASSSSSMWPVLALAIISALFALGTPCVFPMIPMTVSFFLKDNTNPVKARLRAVMFGVFIVLIFTLPIAALILATYFGGGETLTADVFNWLATHWIPNVIFFLVFMIFAASLLGAFEIRMPSKLVNRSDKNADRAGMVGVFFLALTLVLVSFSCTLPIVGGALVQSAQGEFWRPIATMLVFSVMFALPFTFFAFFPRLMERLPKSGGWLNSVKVVLGLAEIALGLKFLSVADQTYHWGILDREVYLAIWIVVFTLLGLYLLGKIKFKYDSEVTHIGVGRLAAAIAVFSFVVWLVPGMWGAPLKAISGYLPPMSTQEFVSGEHTGAPPREDIKYSDILHLPHGMSGYFDFEQGMAHAREAGKPVFLDFTGHGCVNCREMEQRVWVDPEVQRILREEYVVVALYSDDRARLPETEWLTTPAGKILKTLGRKNSYIVNTRYGVSAQPAYLLLDGDGNLLVPVYGYDLDIDNYIEFLRDGVQAYKRKL
jgi:thiol:disulfide interchange protein DsbD